MSDPARVIGECRAHPAIHLTERILLLAADPSSTMRAGSEPFGFERLPVTGLAAAIIAFLAAPSLGPVATLVQLACLAAILTLRWRRVPHLLIVGMPLLALGLFAAASALWSDVPAISLRYGLQLVVTAVMGIALGRLLTLRELVVAVFIGTSIACLAGLASGRVGMSESGPVLIGLAGSKNQISYIALFWLGSALCVLASGAHRTLTRIAAALALVPALFLIVQGDSATALVSAAVLAALLGLLALGAVLGRSGRLFALVAAALLAIPAAVALPQIEREIAIIQTDVLGKDQRLTGRTLLWEEADRLIRQAPLIGHGYKAIWLGPKGKGLLARNGQKDGRAFHFHDTFRELMADLGIIGLVLFLLPLAYAGLRSVVLLIAAIDAPRAFAVAMLFIILLRVRTELLVGPFLMETVLLIAVVAALAALPLAAPEVATTPAPRRSARRPSSRPQRNPA